MANQVPKRRPAFVTQRDGSSLANSNCRMASICMGLDYETNGADKATGSKMRSYTADQSGGTDSGDAREAWDNGYNESLDVEDGRTFGDAVAALRSGRMVHLDVWHASLNDGCISGSGAYGHTIAIVPDYNGEWLVGDPWCTEGYERVPESRLKTAAEEWGRRVYGAAALEADYPTSGPDPTDPLVRVIVRRIVKRLMDRSYPGHEAPIDDYPDTGGAQPILYTQTHAQPLTGEDMGPTYSPSGAAIGQATVSKDGGNIIATSDGQFHPIAKGTVRNVFAVGTITSGNYDGDSAYLVQIPGGEESGLLLAALATYKPNPDTGGSNEERDAEWVAWLLEGSPGT